MNSARQILEIDKVLDQLRYFIKTTKGLSILDSLDVYENKEQLEDEYIKLQEMIEVVNKYNDLPIVSHINVLNEINQCKKGMVLDESKLNLIKEELLSIKDLKSFFNKINEKPEHLDLYFKDISFDESLYEKINRTITKENTVADSASKKLSEIRRDLGKIEREIRSTINKLMIVHKDQLSGDNFVLRDGVFVLPVNTSFKASVDGIVHDISDSGQTTFIQPTAIVNLENNKHVLEFQERDEVNRILKELTYLIISKEDELIKNNNIIGYLDVLNAKVTFLKDIDGSIPVINKNGDINLFNARHPLLNKDKVISNDFRLQNEKTLMLISGPNAGGKTIALKTVAVIAYMTKLGLPIPASSGSEIGFYRKIYVNIGDGQSIENNLSTFSSHVSVLANLIKYITANDLVVIDELGNGTDPKEGEALSMSVVEYLLEKKCKSLISSHYTLLKQYSLTNKNIQCTSFIFDEVKIEPTFKIAYDITGKSYGFVIAKKYGLLNSIIDRAKEFYDSNYFDDNDRKLKIIEDKERELYNKNLALEEKINSINNENENINKRLENLKNKENNLKEKKLENFDILLDEKIKEVETIVEEFKKSNKENSKAVIDKLSKIEVLKQEKQNIEIGDFVSVKGLGIEGKVVLKDKNKINVVTVDGMTVKASIDQCVKVEKIFRKQKIANIDKMIYEKKRINGELNLIGYHIDEALPCLEKYLSDCYASSIKQVRIIHGFGTGKLRMAIHSKLKTINFVESFKLGNDNDGGGGSTIVNLK